jgi:hypothetical protein
MRNAYKILVGKPEGKRPLRNLGIDRRIMLKWILRKLGRKVLNGFFWLRLGTNSGVL